MCFHCFFSLIYRIPKPQNVRMQPVTSMQTVYKAPGQANGKIIEATAPARDWQDGAQALSNNDQHSFAKALQHVVGNDNNIKFLAYNNAPPGVANVKTKSNSKEYSWERAIVYKAPGQASGKIIESTAAAAWQNGAQPLTNDARHSFATALQHVVGNDNNAKFLAYNNAPPGIPNLKTKSNSKGVIILATNADSAAWIVHTVPGFPAAKTGYSWPVAENNRGHLLICLTISESQINAIAASLLLVQPLIHYNDIPKTETAAMPYFNKLAEGKISTLPPFTSRQTIRTQSGAAPVTVHIYSKSESSKYEIYKKVIVKVLKKTIKVWSRRDSKLKGDCRGSQRHIRLIKSPAAINGHNTNLESDITNWAVSDPGNIFCHIDKPYFKNQTREPAMAVCIDNINIFTRFDAIAAQLEDLTFVLKYKIILSVHTYTMAILYKAPGQATGKIIEATAAAGDWQDGAQALSNPNQHSFATALQHVVGDHQNAKFLAYNNAPPGVPSIKTKSNSKGVIILATNADSAAWIVHTVPGFPAAKTGYNWPLAENARGHLLICLTISESQINAIGLAIVYKAPGQASGKIIESTAAAAWQNGAQPLTNDARHSFATALQHVVGNDNNAKFLAYNNAPPGIPNLKTKSNSKGVIILATNADSAAWIVHTVPGFPAAKTGYSWPVAENNRGHLLICLTISESQINAIAASLLLVQPLIHYNDIPKTETAAMPYFNKLAEGKIPTLPPFTSRQTIRTQDGPAPVTVHIYSKSESSKYEIYKKVIAKVLKKTIKVWSRRDSKLKGDCRVSQRHIRLIKSPAVVVDHNTNLEADITNWAVSDPGNIFCHIDKPYMKNQTREPAMAEWSFGSLKKTVYRLPNNTVAMWSVKTYWKNLGYLLLNKIAPLVIPRSDKSMEEAVDTADKVTTASLLLVQAVVHYNDVPEKETAPMQHFNKLEFRNFTKKLFQSFEKSAKSVNCK
ncbi:Deoxyribonuclease-2-alpha [Trichinella britovi]|uniref:Deoxyribonuclease-2-alpha n=1 Tax=Trichinella britovi TaxID=45882 RepID=A0A0V1C7Y9_TRIBR|nr:Deoxyribonuclease-2-alpha [Trichinella britovi]